MTNHWDQIRKSIDHKKDVGLEITAYLDFKPAHHPFALIVGTDLIGVCTDWKLKQT